MATFLNRFHDIDMSAIARWQYGQQATVWSPGDHAYSWAAKKPNDNTRYSLDLHAYVRAVYGPDCKVVQKGFHAYDWARFYPLAPENDYSIQPAVFVASDQIWNVQAIAQGVSNYRHNVGAMADWFFEKTGRKLKLLEPQVFGSDLSSQQWLAIYKAQEDRYDTWKKCVSDILKAYDNRTNPKTIYLVTQFCGLDALDWDWDAAGGLITAIPSQGFVACASAFACCHRFALGTPTPYDETVIYALSHELGHCLGLDHTPENQPGWQQSFMRSARIPWAQPTAAENAFLQTSPYLT